MDKIESVNNKKIQYLLKLKNKKFRSNSNQFLLEGRKIIENAILHKINIIEIYVKDNDEKNIDFAKNNFDNFILVKEHIFNKICTTVQPQGIVCLCDYNTQHFVLPQGNNLILDNIQDPGNLGAIFRIAAATNFLDVYMINCVDCFNEKVIRASMGNLFALKLYKTDYKSIQDNKDKFKSLFLTADMNGENLFDICLPKSRLTVIIGNEGNGVSDQLLTLTDKTISIPMDNNVESLNAAVSTGIILYNLTKGE